MDRGKEGCYKNFDTDARGETADYVKASTFTKAKQIEVIAASVRWRSHANVGKPRDDAFHFAFDKNSGWNFVAVADGAGSAKYSRKGSELATQTVVKELQEKLTVEFTRQHLRDIQLWESEFVTTLLPWRLKLVRQRASLA